MRKSERLRLVEMQLLRLEFELEVIKAGIDALLESNKVKSPELDAGKWYKAKLN